MNEIFPIASSLKASMTGFCARRLGYRMMTILSIAGSLLYAASPARTQQRVLTNSVPQTAPTPPPRPETPSTAANYAQFPANCTVAPSSIPAGQSATVNITVSFASSLPSDRLQFSVAKAIPGGTPMQLGSYVAERGGRAAYTFSLPINEPSPGTVRLQVYLAKQYIAAATTPISSCDLAIRGGSGGNNIDPRIQTGEKLAEFLINKIKDHKHNSSGNQDNKAQTVTVGATTVQYPRGWTFHQEVVDNGGPINIRNFESHQSGGAVPSGGGEIDITDAKSSGETLSAVLQSELGATRTEDLLVDGRPALRAYYTDFFTSDLTYENQAVYVMDGKTIHKFFLSYRSGDPHREGFIQAFQTIISSARFTPQ